VHFQVRSEYGIDFCYLRMYQTNVSPLFYLTPYKNIAETIETLHSRVIKRFCTRMHAEGSWNTSRQVARSPVSRHLSRHPSLTRLCYLCMLLSFWKPSSKMIVLQNLWPQTHTKIYVPWSCVIRVFSWCKVWLEYRPIHARVTQWTRRDQMANDSVQYSRVRVFIGHNGCNSCTALTLQSPDVRHREFNYFHVPNQNTNNLDQ
jgi:hypothetical protein